MLKGLGDMAKLMKQAHEMKKKMEEMRSGISVGDEVRTIGGIIGTVVAEHGDVFTIDIGGQDMRVVKRAVAESLTEREGDSE